MDEKIAKLNEMIRESKRIVFFGGAGVSTESGIPDFRSTDGLYNQTYQYPPEMIVSHTFYEDCPEEFFDFYKNRMLFLDAKPNAAHLKLAELEKAGKLTAVITQNIDGLHQAAGSKTVMELHGSVLRNSGLRPSNSLATTANFISWNNTIRSKFCSCLFHAASRYTSQANYGFLLQHPDIFVHLCCQIFFVQPFCFFHRFFDRKFFAAFFTAQYFTVSCSKCTACFLLKGQFFCCGNLQSGFLRNLFQQSAVSPGNSLQRSQPEHVGQFKVRTLVEAFGCCRQVL